MSLVIGGWATIYYMDMYKHLPYVHKIKCLNPSTQNPDGFCFLVNSILHWPTILDQRVQDLMPFVGCWSPNHLQQLFLHPRWWWPWLPEKLSDVCCAQIKEPNTRRGPRVVFLFHAPPENRHWSGGMIVNCLAIWKSFRQTICFIQQQFWCKSITKDVKKYITTCPISAWFNNDHQPPTGLLQPLPIPRHPWSHIAILWPGYFMTGQVFLYPWNGWAVIRTCV